MGSNDEARGIAIDAQGYVHLSGSTASLNFPIAQAVQPNPGARLGLACFDAFVAKLQACGSALIYSTYLGGSAREQGNGVALDIAGNAYVTGFTQSADFPLAAALQPAFGGPSYDFFGDAFVVKIAP